MATTVTRTHSPNVSTAGLELELLIKQAIDTYNRKRPHLSLVMKTPNEIHQKACAANHTGLVNYN